MRSVEVKNVSIRRANMKPYVPASGDGTVDISILSVGRGRSLREHRTLTLNVNLSKKFGIHAKHEGFILAYKQYIESLVDIWVSEILTVLYLENGSLRETRDSISSVSR
jgi:hypothetical protein